MKLQVVLCFCLYSVAFANDDWKSLITGYVERERSSFSPAARAQLREAGKLAVEFLCKGENVDPQISSTICERAQMTGLNKPDWKTRTYKRSGMFKRQCMDCQVADPICYNGCPQ
ncbi:uncharacterized protein LOC143448728 [Clavelina lepadiformis]|uniref:uncharacterized protein LOC143448728 n=1 Tax=Clavelina lepadiformis TaxID=159417 RepID=UPI0040431EBC